MSHDRNRAPLALFRPIRPVTAVGCVVDQIVDEIRTGRLPSGILLPGERQLAAAMNVSRRTIREAIAVLESAGMAAVLPGPAGGTKITSIWAPDWITGGSEEVETGELFQVLEARRVVEPRVARLAALRGTDEDFRILRETIERQRANQDNILRMVEAEAVFHRQMWRAAQNPEIEAAMQVIYARLSGAFYSAADAEMKSLVDVCSVDLHDETLAAIMRGRADEIEEVMDRHLSYLEVLCEDARGRARMPEIPSFLLGGARTVVDGPD